MLVSVDIVDKDNLFRTTKNPSIEGLSALNWYRGSTIKSYRLSIELHLIQVLYRFYYLHFSKDFEHQDYIAF